MAGIEAEPRDAAQDGAGPFAPLELIGGRVCLDFVNSVDPRAGDHQRDYLTSYADLARWSEYAHVLREGQAAGLLLAAARHQDEAAAVFERAITLRETLYRVFTASASGAAPSSSDLTMLRTAYGETIARSQLVPTPNQDGYRWSWPDGTLALDQMLWPITWSAVELLTSPELRRVKICPGLGDCGWLFLDTSKSGRRRWCSMESCGSRSKMRRYYARTRARPED